MCSILNHSSFVPSGMPEPSRTEDPSHGVPKAIVSKPNIHSSMICTYIYVCMHNRFEQRLLHPGANTADIITQYISAIRSLKVLDPTGVIIERVCQPIKDYLR